MLVACYETKKQLKINIGQPLRFLETSLHGPEYRENGRLYVVGPGAYERKWYAEVWMTDSRITKVR